MKTKPHKYVVIYRNNKNMIKQINTDNLQFAEKKAILNNGTIYIDTRYKVKLRLYYYILKKEMFKDN